MNHRTLPDLRTEIALEADRFALQRTNCNDFSVLSLTLSCRFLLHAVVGVPCGSRRLPTCRNSGGRSKAVDPAANLLSKMTDYSSVARPAMPFMQQRKSAHLIAKVVWNRLWKPVLFAKTRRKTHILRIGTMEAVSRAVHFSLKQLLNQIRERLSTSCVQMVPRILGNAVVKSVWRSTG